MWETFRNAWKIKDLRYKILYTLFMLLIYRLLCFVPTPGINVDVVASVVNDNGLLGFINSMTGSRLDQFTVMAMGITPYINSSIIMQLLAVAIPKLEELQKEGDEGRKKIAQYTRYLTIVLGFIQAVALSIGLPAKVPKCVLSGKGCGNSKTTRMLAQKQPYIQRVRNSSLVESPCAENVRG